MHIPLSQGAIAIVDDLDYPILSKYNWYLSHYGYAIRNAGGGKKIWMHRQLCPTESTLVVDHINNIKLDNRRANLRPLSRGDNTRNRVVPNKNNTSGFLGVSWHSHNKKWHAQIKIHRRNISIGFFDSKIEAAEARKTFAANN